MSYKAGARTNGNGYAIMGDGELGLELKTQGLSGLIARAAKVDIKLYNLKKIRLSQLLNSNKYSLVAHAILRDFKIEDTDLVLHGVVHNYKVIAIKSKHRSGRYTGYKEYGATLFPL